jgi:hypothetical protein
MTDNQFLSIINKMAAENRLRLTGLERPALPPEEVSADALAAWAALLEGCVKHGVKLADDRWSRVVIKQDKPVTVFALDGTRSTAPDSDFRIGLHLLMRILEKDPSS